MTIAAGIFKTLSVMKQSGLGVPASGAGATSLPRTTSTVDLAKASYTSATIKRSQQRSDMRHGIRSVSGTISGELNVGVYQLLEASILRQAWQAGVTTTALTNVTAQATAPQYARATGSFITDGFKVGDVIRWTGFTATANNDNNFLITALTALEMTGIHLNGDAVAAEDAGSSVTAAVEGKKTWIPQTSHTRDYYSIEHWHSDVEQSELFTDCMFGQMAVSLPATGMATINFPVMGLNMTPATSQVLTSPTDATEGGNLAAVNGAIYVDGVKVALITSLDFTVNGNVTAPGGVVGSNVDPDLFPGAFDVTGNASVYFQDTVMRDIFLDEDEVVVIAAFTTGSEKDANFKAYTLPRVKFNAATKDDGEKGLIQSMSFSALENIDGGTTVNSLPTTISVQDSLAA